MPRYARIISPGDRLHVISRFVNGEHRLTSKEERREYLRRVGTTLAITDWVIVSFALMSSHIHLGVLAGYDLFSRWSKPLHSGFASWLNRRQGKFGPVFAERPKTVIIKPESVGRLIAYHHNNPVLAKVASSASDSTWTSHRAYLGLETPPSWLDVELGLSFCGLTNDSNDREAFDRYVEERCEPDPLLEGGDLREARRELRAELGSAVEMSYPIVDLRLGEIEHGAIVTPEAVLHPIRNIEVTRLIDLVAQHRGASNALIRSPTRIRHVVRVRKVIVCLGTILGLNLTELGRGLGISAQAAGKLAKNAGPQEHSDAEEIARGILGC